MKEENKEHLIGSLLFSIEVSIFENDRVTSVTKNAFPKK